ncbi:hypothetical protein KUCAC02_027452 [Chaenocephalus aceratus]|uniref:Uncharacterized protein n=1 Tax=Chaenocephalus aceratus TaxID=36190 RepID=A0ACB9W4Z5_CHAAC|nr:hypothetical protein KUCAC02_027452 [Chaenocephalus aceratus]
MYSPPVDLSFKDISSVTGALAEVPRSGLRPLKPNSKGKYSSHSFRLSNNNIPDLVGLQFMLGHFLAQPLKLGWLDLSFNKITCIEPVLCELRELRVLYLHGNAIWNLPEVDRLRELPYLHSITLHGNAIDKNKNYRNRVISALPHLKKLDYSSVTCDERRMVNAWHQGSKHGGNSKQSPQ